MVSFLLLLSDSGMRLSSCKLQYYLIYYTSKVHNPTAVLKVTVYDQDLITDDWIGQFSYKISELTQTDNPPLEGFLLFTVDKT